MGNYQIKCTIIVNTEAEDENEALEIAEECADWSNADWSIREGEQTPLDEFYDWLNECPIDPEGGIIMEDSETHIFSYGFNVEKTEGDSVFSQMDSKWIEQKES
jgi:hypothetical protein